MPRARERNRNNMRKFHIVGITLFAMLAFGAFSVSSAFALETVWLEGGVKPTEALLVESEAELLLTDTKEGTVVLCSGLDEGFIATGGNAKLDEVTRILNLELTSSTILCTFSSKTPGSCEESSSPNAMAVGLPWKTELVLVGAQFLDLLTSASGKVGWDLTCLVIGITILDECTLTTGETEVTNGTEGNALVLFSELLQKKALCTLSGEETGVVEGEDINKAASGEALAVSEG
jgi:hypothetical protein